MRDKRMLCDGPSCLQTVAAARRGTERHESEPEDDLLFPGVGPRRLQGDGGADARVVQEDGHLDCRLRSHSSSPQTRRTFYKQFACADQK